MIRVIIAIVFCMLFMVSPNVPAADTNSFPGEKPGTVVMEIDYGTVRPPRTTEVSAAHDGTVLEALQTVATVETHPVGKYVFVTAIDGVKGKRGETAWYYTVDGKSPGRLAYAKPLEGARHIRWIYKQDVCSRTVDKQHKASQKPDKK
jgi:hypothetical protein